MDPAKLLMSSRIAVLKRPRTVIRALAFARHDHGAGALPSHFHVRALSSSALPKMASSVASPRFSAGSDLDTAGKTLALLLTSGGGRWMLTENGEGLERTFKFKTFAKTWVCLVLSFDLSIFLPLCISYLQNSSTEPYSIRISCSSSLSPLSPPSLLSLLPLSSLSSLSPLSPPSLLSLLPILVPLPSSLCTLTSASSICLSEYRIGKTHGDT